MLSAKGGPDKDKYNGLQGWEFLILSDCIF